MIENLESEILHLKAVRRPVDPALPVCDFSPAERSNTKKADGRIPQFPGHGQFVLQTSQTTPQQALSGT